MRTTIDLDPGVLRALKHRSQQEGKTLGQIVSELLAPVLAVGESPSPPDLVWQTGSLGLTIDLEDKEAVWRALDRAAG